MDLHRVRNRGPGLHRQAVLAVLPRLVQVAPLAPPPLLRQCLPESKNQVRLHQNTVSLFIFRRMLDVLIFNKNV